MQKSKNLKKNQKKTKKGRHLSMLGVAGGERGNSIGLKFFVDPAGANVMADANLDVDRTQGSWAVAP